MAPAGGKERLVVLGRIVGPFGVRGWVKLLSYTEPPAEIMDFTDWRLRLPDGSERLYRPEEGRRHGKGLVARLAGIADRDAAIAISNSEVCVERAALPAAGPGKFYQVDLLGLEVYTESGIALGRIDHFVEGAANAIMVVHGERERWLPLVPQFLKKVDLEGGRVVVDWDPDF